MEPCPRVQTRRNYGYDELGQLTEAKRHWADHTGVRGQAYGYGFDDLGNRERTTRNGARVGRYEVNGVNEYGYRTVAGMVDVLGTVHTNATVTVNGQGTVKQGEYFHREVGFSNLTQVVYGSLTNLAVLRDGSNPDVVLTNVGKVFLPASPEVYTQDADGNLTQDGRWSYTWDAENRLTQMETITAASSAGVPRQKLEFAYDAGGRRLQKTVSLWNGSTYVGQYTNRFVYDGWNLIMEFRVGSGLRLERSYVWGLDVSETWQGAGGVGGLLALNTYTNGTLNGTHLVSYDGNGNVVALLEASTGLESARYEYGPFGELIRVTGALANLNPFRFSTKYEDLETGLLYYGYRYYSASTGRWLSRDPIGELGGLNLYGFVGNEPTGYYDFLGLDGKPLWRRAGEGFWNLLGSDIESDDTADRNIKIDRNYKPRSPERLMHEEVVNETLKGSAESVGRLAQVPDDILREGMKSSNPGLRAISAGTWGATWCVGLGEVNALRRSAQAERSAALVLVKGAVATADIGRELRLGKAVSLDDLWTRFKAEGILDLSGFKLEVKTEKQMITAAPAGHGVSGSVPTYGRVPGAGWTEDKGYHYCSVDRIDGLIKIEIDEILLRDIGAARSVIAHEIAEIKRLLKEVGKGKTLEQKNALAREAHQEGIRAQRELDKIFPPPPSGVFEMYPKTQKPNQ